MSIRKIIKEEIDEFDWIRDSEPIDLKNHRWIIENDISMGIGESRKLQEFLYSQGFKWPRSSIESMLRYETKFYFVEKDNPIGLPTIGQNFDGYDSWNRTLGRMVTNGYKVHKWSVIKKEYGIN